MLRARSVLLAYALTIPAISGSAARAAQAPPSTEPLPEIRIARAAGQIVVDGDLSDAGWNGVPWVETFWETNRGDNTPPPAPTRARLAYDGAFLYAAFEFDDPHPERIRAPLGDHDVVPGDTDYGGIILDTRNEGRTALMFLANPRGVQYDAVNSDVSGEDPSLDLYWDAAGRITPEGWRLEIRVPFSSLRYERGDGSGEQAWRVLLYRNYPRDFRYQVFSSRLPRGSNCFICHSRPLAGLAGLPPGGHLVAAPYGSGRRTELPQGEVGTPLGAGDMQGEAGLDLKWTPNADTALDATINPDFSQVESDVAQISANERFALFFPEKRPFFLEGLDLFATPVQAVYTRTVTDPAWGARATGQLAGAAYTFLLTDDRGGGSVILPGPRDSSFADQDFSSQVLIGRARRDLRLGGKNGGAGSFASFLVTAREHQGGGYNRVFGPDFQWRPGEGDAVTGQLLWSDTLTPERPDLAAEWDGRRLTDHALHLSWDHSTRTWNWFTEYMDFGADFRADTGFVPRVGFRETAFELRRSFYPAHGIFSQVRPLAAVRYGDEPGTGLALRRWVPGVILEGKWNSYVELRWKAETVRADQGLFSPNYLTYFFQFSPSRSIGRIQLDGEVGERVDFVNGRLGRGGNLNLSTNLRPTDHLALELVGGWSRLDVDAGSVDGGGAQRLFTAEVLRLKVNYTFTARTFLRLIGQHAETRRDVDLYTVAVDPLDEGFSGSALFAYKINWQTVLFLGYGDERTLSEVETLEPARRELFLKVSYAVQR